MKQPGNHAPERRHKACVYSLSGNPCLIIQPPPEDRGLQRLYRVVYIIDVNAKNPTEAAEYTHQIMSDPESMPPVLQVIDHTGKCTTIDLSEHQG